MEGKYTNYAEPEPPRKPSLVDTLSSGWNSYLSMPLWQKIVVVLVVVIVIGLPFQCADKTRSAESSSSESAAASTSTDVAATASISSSTSKSAIEMVKLPDFTGKMLSDISDEIDALKLKCEYQKTDGSRASVVVENNWRIDGQEPDAGNVMQTGDTIKLIVTNVVDEKAAQEQAERDAQREREEAERQAEAERKAAEQAEREAAAVNQPVQESRTVYVTPTGKKYHSEGCRTLKGEKTPMTLEEAQAQGYEPCGVCGG